MALVTARSGKTGDSKKGSKRESVNDVLREFARSGKLLARILPTEEPNDVPLALIEADREALILLGRLMIAQAHATDDGIQIAPKGPGNRLFKRASTIGLYIHRSGPRRFAKSQSKR
jgi:hypothetical protein